MRIGAAVAAAERETVPKRHRIAILERAAGVGCRRQRRTPAGLTLSDTVIADAGGVGSVAAIKGSSDEKEAGS